MDLVPSLSLPYAGKKVKFGEVDIFGEDREWMIVDKG